MYLSENENRLSTGLKTWYIQTLGVLLCVPDQVLAELSQTGWKKLFPISPAYRIMHQYLGMMTDDNGVADILRCILTDTLGIIDQSPIVFPKEMKKRLIFSENGTFACGPCPI